MEQFVITPFTDLTRFNESVLSEWLQKPAIDHALPEDRIANLIEPEEELLIDIDVQDPEIFINRVECYLLLLESNQKPERAIVGHTPSAWKSRNRS